MKIRDGRKKSNLNNHLEIEHETFPKEDYKAECWSSCYKPNTWEAEAEGQPRVQANLGHILSSRVDWSTGQASVSTHK